MEKLMNNEKHYITLNNYLQYRFNKKVFKISLNGNFTCPNRDGTISKIGCLFCSENGSGDFAGEKTKTFQEQFHDIEMMMRKKWHDGYYIAYLQANTNTYDTIENLEKKYSEIINLDPRIKIFSIATRPDCVSDEVIELLKKLNNKIEIWIELGFQTSNEYSARFINRGYNNQCLIDTVNKLYQANITTIVHIINGLPTDTYSDMIDTVKFLNVLPISGIKIHMLHIMKNTPLCKIYEENPFKLLSLEEYTKVVCEQLRHLNTNIVIHRITGDAPKDLLVAPEWTLKKFVVMNEIDKLMRKNNWYQGDKLKNNQ